MKDYVMRYRKGQIPVTTGIVQASTMGMAETLGKKWCMEHTGYRFICVEDPVLVREEVAETYASEKPGLTFPRLEKQGK